MTVDELIEELVCLKAAKPERADYEIRGYDDAIDWALESDVDRTVTLLSAPIEDAKP